MDTKQTRFAQKLRLTYGVNLGYYVRVLREVILADQHRLDLELETRVIWEQILNNPDEEQIKVVRLIIKKLNEYKALPILRTSTLEVDSQEDIHGRYKLYPGDHIIVIRIDKDYLMPYSEEYFVLESIDSEPDSITLEYVYKDDIITTNQASSFLDNVIIFKANLENENDPIQPNRWDYESLVYHWVKKTNDLSAPQFTQFCDILEDLPTNAIILDCTPIEIARSPVDYIITKDSSGSICLFEVKEFQIDINSGFIQFQYLDDNDEYQKATVSIDETLLFANPTNKLDSKSVF